MLTAKLILISLGGVLGMINLLVLIVVIRDIIEEWRKENGEDL